MNQFTEIQIRISGVTKEDKERILDAVLVVDGTTVGALHNPKASLITDFENLLDDFIEKANADANS